MALHQCSECGGKVSDQAAACPHCGTPIAIALTQARPADPASTDAGEAITAPAIAAQPMEPETRSEMSNAAPASPILPAPVIAAPSESPRREGATSVSSLLKKAKEISPENAQGETSSEEARTKAAKARLKEQENAISVGTGGAIVLAIFATYPLMKLGSAGAAMRAISDRPILLLGPLFYAAMAIGIANRSRVCAAILTLVAAGTGIYFLTQDGLKMAVFPFMVAFTSGSAFVAMKQP